MEKTQILQLIAELRFQHERTKATAEFMHLKQSELRPGDEISMWGYMQERERLEVEANILAGHN